MNLNKNQITEKKKLSIIIPVYNVENFIEKCAESLLSQDYEDIEYLFVNDCTPDNSITVLQSVVDRYPNRCVRIVNHSKNCGIATTRNTGVRNANGEYIMQIDSDDYLEDVCAIKKIMNAIEEADADIALYDIKFIYKNSTKFEASQFKGDNITYVKDLIERNVPLCLWNGIYRKSLFFNYNIWCVDGYNFGEDYAVKSRLAYAANKIITVPGVYYCYRQDNLNSYTKNYNKKTLIDINKNLSILHDFFSSKEEWETTWSESLDIAITKIKADQLLYWAAGIGTIDEFKEIKEIEIPKIGKKASLSYNQKFALMCAKYNFPRLLKFTIKSGLKIKSLLR